MRRDYLFSQVLTRPFREEGFTDMTTRRFLFLAARYSLRFLLLLLFHISPYIHIYVHRFAGEGLDAVTGESLSAHDNYLVRSIVNLEHRLYRFLENASLVASNPHSSQPLASSMGWRRSTSAQTTWWQPRWGSNYYQIEILLPLTLLTLTMLTMMRAGRRSSSSCSQNTTCCRPLAGRRSASRRGRRRWRRSPPTRRRTPPTRRRTSQPANCDLIYFCRWFLRCSFVIFANGGSI